MMGPNVVSGAAPKKQHVFAEVPQAEIERSSFDRSHGLKTTFNAMQLVPVYVDEVLPGDTFNMNATFLCRMATPIKPVMDNLYLDVFFFAVPNRLVWGNGSAANTSSWQRFNGEQDNPTDSVAWTVPQVVSPAGGWLEGSLYDYFGLPINVAGISVSNLHGRAYNLIWNQWFRDQNLQTSVTVDQGAGPDTVGNYAVLNRGKRHDYFTSALPWPQKGTAVSLSLGTTAPIIVNTAGGYPASKVFEATTASGGLNPNGDNEGGVLGTSPSLGYTTVDFGYVGGVTPGINPGQGSRWGTGAWIDNSQNLLANLAAAVGPTIDSLRQAFGIQKLLERDARGGTRYTEIIRSHFGVVSPDARLQRPEYLGGGSQRINVTPVAQSSVTAATPQGNLAAYAVAVSGQNGFTKSFTEHCVLVGLACVRADLTYQQGVNKMWLRSTRYDFYWPALAHLGEQAVLNEEIYAQGTAGGGADAAVFGYQERYAEYRYKPSQITGQFRSTYSAPLDYWHLADHYTALPTLGSTWISAAPPMARVEAVSGGPDFLMDCHFSLKCARPMPLYGVPGFTDRF